VADKFGIVRTVTPTTAGTQDYTFSGLGTFSAAIFIVSGAIADDTTRAHGKSSIGFVDSAGNQAGLANRSENARVTNVHNNLGAINGTSVTGTTIITFNNTANTIESVAVWSANITDGVRLNWTTPPAVAYEMTVILFGGLLNATAQKNNAATAGGNNISLGYNADVLIFGCPGEWTSSNSPGSSNNGAWPGIGFCINNGSATQKSIYTNWINLPADTISDSDAIADSTHAGGAVAQGGGSSTSTTISFPDATSFTATASGGSPDFTFLALKFSDARKLGVALEALPASTGPASFTGAGTKPVLVIGGGNLLTSSDSLTDGATAATFSFFCFNSSTANSAGMAQQEGVDIGNPTPTTVANSRSSAAPVMLLDHNGALAAQASFTSFDTLGFTLNFSTATTGRGVFLAIGGPLVTSETVTVSDAAILRSRLIVNETVTISEQAQFSTVLRAAETVTISDGAVLVLETVIPTPTAEMRAGTSQGGAIRAATSSGGAELAATL
jgi:hypothetical protein